MPALIVLPSPSESLKQKVSDYFDDYILLELDPDTENFYKEANKAVELAKTVDNNVFLICYGKPEFNALLSAKLAYTKPHFYIAFWTGLRFKILRVP